jgi:hypothetical protein
MEGRTNLVGNLLNLAAKEACPISFNSASLVSAGFGLDSPAQLGSSSFGLASLGSASLGLVSLVSAILSPASLGSARCNLASFAKDLIPNTTLTKKFFINGCPAVKTIDSISIYLLKFAPSVGLAFGGDGPKTVVGKNFLSSWTKKITSKSCRNLAGTTLVYIFVNYSDRPLN